MQPIRLDFCRAPRAPRWVAPLLMAIAVAFAGDVAFSTLRAHRDIQKTEEALARLDPRHFKPARRVAADEVAAGRETLARLATPWERLFAALEGAASENVALLAIEPDPKAGTVTISGDGKDYLAALTYVLNLSRADALARVQLMRHETKADPGRPVNFAVSASWGAPQRQESSSRGGS